MSLELSSNFRQIANGFPPCTSNIRRKYIFDDPKLNMTKQQNADKNFMPKKDLLSTVRKQKNCCSNGWAISAVTCLSDHFGLREGVNPELDESFIISCYTPQKYLSYYKDWGCGGDSVYNAIFFLYVNGTLRDVCWENNKNDPQCTYVDGTTIPSIPKKILCSRKTVSCDNPLLYRVGESPHPGPNPDSFNVSPILKNGELLNMQGNAISTENAINYMKYKIKEGPVVASFIVLDSMVWSQEDLLSGFAGSAALDWNLKPNGVNFEIDRDDPNSGIYYPTDLSSNKIVGYHSVVVVGWGIKEIEGKGSSVPYWICRNSWGEEWRTFYDDVPNGYWKHAMYPHNLISCVDVSIDSSDSILKKLPYSDKGNPLGGMISMTASDDPLFKLDVSSLKNAPYLKDFGEQYPTYMWIIVFICLIIIFGKFVS